MPCDVRPSSQRQPPNNDAYHICAAKGRTTSGPTLIKCVSGACVFESVIAASREHKHIIVCLRAKKGANNALAYIHKRAQFVIAMRPHSWRPPSARIIAEICAHDLLGVRVYVCVCVSTHVHRLRVRIERSGNEVN